jgi:uncharacterized protein (DUF427 family)
MRQPGPDHPITIEKNPKRVVVSFAGQAIASSERALTLREASYPPVQYIPRQDVDMSKLVRTDHQSHCPYKGDASYFSIRVGDREAKNAVWSYEHPYPAVAQIEEHVAFYPDRVDAIRET